MCLIAGKRCYFFLKRKLEAPWELPPFLHFGKSWILLKSNIRPRRTLREEQGKVLGPCPEGGVAGAAACESSLSFVGL